MGEVTPHLVPPFSDKKEIAMWSFGQFGRRGLFAEIDEAYRVLGDVGARTLYDRLGHRAFAPEGVANGDRPGHGEDLHYAIEIEFEDSLRGLRVVLDVDDEAVAERAKFLRQAAKHRFGKQLELGERRRLHGPPGERIRQWIGIVGHRR